MALAASIRKITKEALGPGAPPWVDNLLDPLNFFIRQTSDLLNGRVSVENLNQAWFEVTVNAGEVPAPVALPKLQAPEVYGLQVVHVEILASAPGVPIAIPEDLAAVSAPLWDSVQLASPLGNGQVAGVQILRIVGLPTGTRATIRFLASAR